METYLKWKGYEVQPFALEVNREEVYADLGKEGKHRFISLNDLGEPVTEKDLFSEEVQPPSAAGGQAE